MQDSYGENNNTKENNNHKNKEIQTEVIGNNFQI